MDFIPLKLLLSLLIGAAIGLEREAHDNPVKKNGDETAPHSVGIRTFALITSLGTLSGFLIKDYFPLFAIVSIAFMVLTITYYIFHTMLTKDNGFTTELAILFSYLIGVFIARDIFPLQVIFAVAVILILILSRKEDIKNFIFGIKREELNAFISFALVALVVLPFLPNRPFSVSNFPQLEQFLSSYGLNLGKLAEAELINPFKIWLVVVLITGIDIAGYTLEKFVGQRRGRLLASLVGGFISSTATTQALAQESKQSKGINRLVGSAILATSVSFLPIFLLIASVNPLFLVQITPTLLILLLSSIVVGLFFFFIDRKTKDIQHIKEKREIKESDIFAIGPALKFALLFLIVRIVTQVSLLLFGESGFLISSALAGLTGIDAATINIAELSGKAIDVKLAIFAFIIVNAVNLGAKTFYSFVQGERSFAIKLGIGMTIVILVSLIGLLF